MSNEFDSPESEIEPPVSSEEVLDQSEPAGPPDADSELTGEMIPADQAEEEERTEIDVLSELKQRREQETRESPVITIHIQSWATPIVGLLMLVFGLLGGFFVRPMLPDTLSLNATPTETPAVSEVEPPTSDQASSQAQGQQQPQSSEADRQALMAALLPMVRHFKGNPDAPITLIEFSDFQ